jgi:starch synthase
MKIIMASSELVPFAYTGELGKNVRTLAVELKKAGHDVSVALPYYRSIAEGGYKVSPTDVEFQVNLGGKRASADILETRSEDGVQVFLVRRDEYFDRSSIYGDTRAYEDNAERFIFFSKAVLELSRRLTPTPEVIHAHDWPTALIPVFSKERQLPFQTVLTIYDLKHQGSFWSFDFGLTNLPGHYFSTRGVEFYGRFNFLKGGILFADAVVLPGEPAMFEAFTPEGGYGLDAVLQENAARVHGILLGNDYAATNPPLDSLVKGPSSSGVTAAKAAYRQALASRLGISLAPDDVLATVPLNPGDQQTLTPIVPITDLLLTSGFRLILTGEVPAGARAKAITASCRYPAKFATVHESPGTEGYALILAAADLVLIPSSLGYRAQPLIASLRYGTIPVVRFRRGLTQLVTDVQPAGQSGTSFIYYNHQPEGVFDALVRARWLRQDAPSWHELVERAAQWDFSWHQTATDYGALYAELVRHRQAMPA